MEIDHSQYISFYFSIFVKSFSLIIDCILGYACRNKFHANYEHYQFVKNRNNLFIIRNKCQKINPINQEVHVQLFELLFFVILHFNIQIIEFDFVIIK